MIPEHAPLTPEQKAYKFSEIERSLLAKGYAADYFANILAKLPGVPQQIQQEAQFFIWCGRLPDNADFDGRVS